MSRAVLWSKTQVVLLIAMVFFSVFASPCLGQESCPPIGNRSRVVSDLSFVETMAEGEFLRLVGRRLVRDNMADCGVNPRDLDSFILLVSPPLQGAERGNNSSFLRDIELQLYLVRSREEKRPDGTSGIATQEIALPQAPTALTEILAGSELVEATLNRIESLTMVFIPRIFVGEPIRRLSSPQIGNGPGTPTPGDTEEPTIYVSPVVLVPTRALRSRTENPPVLLSTWMTNLERLGIKYLKAMLDDFEKSSGQKLLTRRTLMLFRGWQPVEGPIGLGRSEQPGLPYTWTELVNLEQAVGARETGQYLQRFQDFWKAVEKNIDTFRQEDQDKLKAIFDQEKSN